MTREVRPLECSENIRPLCRLRDGEHAVIQGIYLHGAMRHRLQDLGWIPGTKIQRLHTAGGGDPVAYTGRGTVIALRKNYAKLNWVRQWDQGE